MINDGWREQNYTFGDDEALNERLSALINELCHVFRAHPDGNWKSVYRPKYAQLMAKEIAARPSLIRKLKNLKDPVVSNIVYAAIDLNKADADGQ